MEQLEQCSVARSAECTQIAAKKCTKCKIEKPTTNQFFGPDKRRKYGLRSRCRECDREHGRSEKAKEINKKSYEKNKEQALSQKSEYYKENRDKILEYKKEYHENNKEKRNAYSRNYHKKYYIDNKEGISNRTKAWSEENKERIKDRRHNYYTMNKGLFNANVMERNALKIKATPSWYEKESVIDLYNKAKLLNMSVDHIVPLRSKLVCGLHCIDNLQLMTLEDNRSKGNRWWPDMP